MYAEFGYGAYRLEGPYSKGPGVVGFGSLGEAIKTAEKWLKKGQKWDKKLRRYVEREDGRVEVALWQGTRDSSNPSKVHWIRRGKIVAIKEGKTVTVSTWI